MPEVAAVARQYLCFDVGTRATGVASGNTVSAQGQPLTVIRAVGDARFSPIAKLLAEWRPDALVVGVPRHPDGAPHAMTAHAERFARQLHGRFALPVHTVDERWSTTAARADHPDTDPDAAAAAILLTQFLAEAAARPSPR